jgi:alpha-tubulin suppressor-like RCC1 family protein
MGLTGVQQVVARSAADDNAARTCAVLNSGAVQCWGDNAFGQLGDGTVTARPTAGAPVMNLMGAEFLALGGVHACARTTMGLVFCWGGGAQGQLAQTATDMCGTTPCLKRANIASGVNGVAFVSAGETFSCVLRANQTIACFGGNAFGSLGNGTTISSMTPVPVTGIGNAVGISSGYTFSCAATADRTVQCWGHNPFGQLGDGSTTNRTTPVPAMGLNGVVQVAAGMLHACARTMSGQIYCWGNALDGRLAIPGQLNCGGPIPCILTPTPTPVTNAMGVTAGEGHTCALLANHDVVCWGRNDHGQLGDGTMVNRMEPTLVVW